MTLTPAIQSAIDEAKTCQATTGLPWQLTAAQWALESGWGAHCPGNNCFGIKPYVGCWGTQILSTIEYIDGTKYTKSLPFASFPDVQPCFIKHAELITKGVPYIHAWREWQNGGGDVNRLADLIAPIYATDPNYAKELKELIAEFNATVESADPGRNSEG